MTSHGPRRIVSLQPSVTVILQCLGQMDRLVACTKYCKDVCPEVVEMGLAIVHDSWTITAAQIQAMKPDFVIASIPFQEKSLTEILKGGARFLAMAPKTLDDIYADIAMIAAIVDANEQGEAVIQGMKDDIEEVRSKTCNLRRPRVFCEEWGKPLISSQRWVAELVDAAGGEFLSSPGAQTSAEAILHLDPEVIVAAWCGAGDRVPLEKIIRQRKWEQMCAAQSGRVFCISEEVLNTPAPTLINGLHALGAAIHPEIFPTRQRMRSIATAASPSTAN
jgi:iron complex transport system substrate-binding protein